MLYWLSYCCPYHIVLRIGLVNLQSPDLTPIESLWEILNNVFGILLSVSLIKMCLSPPQRVPVMHWSCSGATLSPWKRHFYTIKLQLWLQMWLQKCIFFNDWSFTFINRKWVLRRCQEWMAGVYCAGLTSHRPEFETKVLLEVRFRQEKYLGY